MNRASHVLKRIVQVVVFVLLAVVGGCAWLVEIPFALTIGWAHFLRTIPPHVTVNHTMVAIGLVILPILAVGTHRVLAWLAAHDAASVTDSTPARPWRWAWSLSMLTIFLLMFVTGIAVFGMLHQVHWLFTDSEFPLQDANFGSSERRTKMYVEFAGKGLSSCLHDTGSLPAHSEPVRLQDVKLPEACRVSYRIDGWKTPLMYTSNGHSYVLTSYGRNKVPGGGTSRFDDYIFADGKFIVPAVQ